jgi:hypothetical protein
MDDNELYDITRIKEERARAIVKYKDDKLKDARRVFHWPWDFAESDGMIMFYEICNPENSVRIPLPRYLASVIS